MNKRIIALILCIGLILGNTASVYADESITSIADEITAASSGDESEETVTEPVSDVNDDIQIEEGSVLLESSEQAAIVGNNQTEQQDVDAEENINQLEDEKSDDVLEEDIVESYSVAVLKAEGGLLQYSESMVLPGAEESSDVNILDLRCFEPGTEVRVKAIPEEGFETDTLTIDYLNSNQQVELVEVNGEYAFTMPVEDIDIHVTFVPLEVAEEVLEEAEEIEELPMMTMALNSEASPEGWDYDDSTNTLILTDYVGEEVENIDAGTAQIYSDGDLTIVLNGTNSLPVSSTYGIYCDGNLTIKGSGSLEIGSVGTGLYAAKGVTVNNNASIVSSDSQNGIVANWGDVTISNASVSVGNSIYAKNVHDISIDNSTVVTEDGMLDGTSITVTGSDLTAGINGLGKLIFTNTDVIANPSNSRKSISSMRMEMNGGSITEAERIEACSFNIENATITSHTDNYILWTKPGTYDSEYNAGTIIKNSSIEAMQGKLGFYNYYDSDAYVKASDIEVDHIYFAFEYSSRGLYVQSGTTVNINSVSCGWSNMLVVDGGEFNVNGDMEFSDDHYSEVAKVQSGRLCVSGNASFNSINVSGGEVEIGGGLSSYRDVTVTGGTLEVAKGITAETFKFSGQSLEVSSTSQAIVADTIQISGVIKAGSSRESIAIVENYSGEKYVEATIDDRIDVSDLTVILSTTSYTYDGEEKQPAVTVKNGDAVLTLETDYIVSYEDNANAGMATVKVTGTGHYKGEKPVTFKISKADAKLSFAESTITKKTTDTTFTNALTKTTDGTVSFTSSDTKVAIVDSVTGLVTIKGYGTVTITATASEGQNYKAGIAKYALTVEAPAPTPIPTVTGFSDVQDPSHPYYKAIYWAAEKNITKGYSDGTFGINKSCTRGEMMMFLWRSVGKPAPKAASKSPFKDVPITHTFYKPILWGYQNGITKGYSDGSFGINRNVSRGEAMMFLWKLKSKPTPQMTSKSPFTDVPTSHAFYKAILWGSQKAITKGYTSGPNKGKFGINDNCTRGQIVTFLYRAR